MEVMVQTLKNVLMTMPNLPIEQLDLLRDRRTIACLKKSVDRAKPIKDAADKAAKEEEANHPSAV